MCKKCKHTQCRCNNKTMTIMNMIVNNSKNYPVHYSSTPLFMHSAGKPVSVYDFHKMYRRDKWLHSCTVMVMRLTRVASSNGWARKGIRVTMILFLI